MHAIDRQAIKETLYPGALATVSPSPLPPGYFGHMPVEMPEYNPDKAKLLAEAGHPNGFTIKDYFISKSFSIPNNDPGAGTAQEGRHQRRTQLVEHATYHDNIRKNLNPFVLYGGTRITDGDVWLGLFFHSEAPDPATNKGTNFAHYKGIDDLIDQGRLERDQQKRAALYHEAQQRIVRDAVCLPIVDVPGLHDPKQVQAPFSAEYGEFALHYTYNYPEMLKILD